GCRFRRRPAVGRVSQESEEDEMDVPQVVPPAAWLAARKDLLAREKEVTHAGDAVDAARRDLPMTEVTSPRIPRLGIAGLKGERHPRGHRSANMHTRMYCT